ncbi:rod shape-determining protein MreD [Sediminitomix flava]|uniref:Rod shape-determining protein MreD n=1 Tax=Sediminitomix flava TaxID=379075 RepID=A0A315Z0H8_SEDFL|nr:rod shape-determining protein MreD [Sediminitomix flava]PWJ36143.1 hypothetical protein BC781_109162 [Sediminitomix flava]
MRNKNIVSIIVGFFGYILIQLLFFRNTQLFGLAFCFPYIAFILLLPFGQNGIGSMVLAFILGITVDIFYDTLGIHAAACVFMAFARNYYLKNFGGGDKYDANDIPSVLLLGNGGFLSLTLPLIFLHHFTFLMIEASNWALIGRTLLQAVLSTVFTALILLCIQMILYPVQKRRL